MWPADQSVGDHDDDVAHAHMTRTKIQLTTCKGISTGEAHEATFHKQQFARILNDIACSVSLPPLALSIIASKM